MKNKTPGILIIILIICALVVLYLRTSQQSKERAKKEKVKYVEPIVEMDLVGDTGLDQNLEMLDPGGEIQPWPGQELAAIETEEQTRRLEQIKELREEAHRKAKAGHLSAAIELLDQALKLDQDNQLLKRDLSNLFVTMGLKQYHKKDYEKARGFFKEALYYWPENQQALRCVAYTYYKQRDWDQAEQWFISYIEEGGDRPDAYSSLGIICYQTNRLEDALYYLRISLSLDPEQPHLVKLADRIRREKDVEADFYQAETHHFLIKYEGRKLPEVSRVVEVVCEEAYIIVGRKLGLYPEDQVTVILYTDEQFQDVTRSPSWAGAVFDGKIRIPAKGVKQRTEVLERIIFHEYTHAVVHEVTGGRAPVWLHEGLAQMNEGRALDHKQLARGLMAHGGPMPLRYLEGSFMEMPAAHARLAYLESLLAIKYLDSEVGPFALRELLRHLSEGNGIAKAISELTYRDYDTFDKNFRKWAKQMAD